MPMTSAERSRKFRAAKTAALGEQRFKQAEAIRKKAERDAKKLVPLISLLPKSEEKKEGSPTTCAELIQKIFDKKTEFYKNNKGQIKISTVKTHLNRVSRLHKAMFKTPLNCDNLEWVKDTAAVIAFINESQTWKAAKSKNAMLESLASVLFNTPEYTAEYKVYSELSISNIVKIRAEQDKGLSKEDNILPWSEIRDLYKTQENLRFKTLLALSSLLPPRRSGTYGLLTLADKKTDLTNDKNYYVMGNEVDILVYKKYKTDAAFGSQTIRVSPELRDIFRAYIAKFKLKVGKPLFSTNKNKSQYYKNFSPQIQGMYKKIIGKKIGMNIVRHSYITNILNQKNISPAQLKNIAYGMGHSLPAQLSYKRVDIEKE